MHAPRDQADRVLHWLSEDRERLRLASRGRGNHPWWTACRIISRFAPHASPATYRALESTVLGHRESNELESMRLRHDVAAKRDLSNPNELGLSWYFLLGALPASRISAQARTAHEILHRKFEGSHRVQYPRREPSGGWVRSPLSARAVRNLSDRAWLRIIGSQKTARERWGHGQHGCVIVSGVEEFARDLAQVAQLWPDRFARLACEFPVDAVAYMCAVLSAVAARRPPDGATDEERASWQAAVLESVGRLLLTRPTSGSRATGFPSCGWWRRTRASKLEGGSWTASAPWPGARTPSGDARR